MTAEIFNSHRRRLSALAYRMLGSSAEAEDALQDAWLRSSAHDASAVANPAAWLTTIVSHLCLDRLRARAAQREQPIEPGLRPPVARDNPERDLAQAEAVGLALLVLLDRLTPQERVAFVLHDLDGQTFDAVARVLDRTPAAARQLASRARRRIQGATPPVSALHMERRTLVERFLAALRAGDVPALLAVVAPDLVVNFDAPAGGVRVIHGAENWVKGAINFSRSLSPATVVVLRVEGDPALALAPAGRLQRLVRFRFAQGRIAALDIQADPAAFPGLELALLP